jgi:hypothetical protein
MGRTLTPERQAKALEARNLREFGYSQQQIADALEAPQPTVCRWLAKVDNDTRAKADNRAKLSRMADIVVSTIDITLYPCRDEDTDGIIPSESIDLILTDPPYLVSDNDITRTNQAS